jgi:hypothetical protein
LILVNLGKKIPLYLVSIKEIITETADIRKMQEAEIKIKNVILRLWYPTVCLHSFNLNWTTKRGKNVLSSKVSTN